MKTPKDRPRNRGMVILTVLFVYILAQLSWWAFLITRLTSQVYEGDERRTQKILMVIGEGMVFAIILLVGFILAYRAFRKEVEYARRQKNFLLSITHEFKTPISSMRLFLETLLKRDLAEEKRKELLEKALQDADRLNELSENILLAARMDSSEFNVDRKSADIVDFIRSWADHHKERVKGGLSFQSETDHLAFSFDEKAFRSILSNLVENAKKYSENGPVSIQLTSSGGVVNLSVIDQGRGIPFAEREIIFEKFYRIQNEETRSAKGTGLGLFIVKRFVEAHGGTIEVKENNPKGTILEVKLPK